jgi:hypothetical protein
MGGESSIHDTSAAKSEGKGPFGRPKGRQKVNIK